MKASPRRNDERRKMVLTFYTLHAMTPGNSLFTPTAIFLLLFSKLCHNTIQIYSPQVVCPLAFFPRLSWQNITGLDGRQRSTVFFPVLLFFIIQDTREQEVGTTHDSLLLSVFILFILTTFPIKKTSWAR